MLPHESYSPDMSSPDFDLFPKLKEHIHGQWFSCLEELSTRTIQHMNKSGVLGGIMLPNVGTQSLRSREIIMKECEQII